jgi:formylmethanofuran dehydrogenase subunit E
MHTPAFDTVVAFHGHLCPGLAIGYRMTVEALALLKESRAEDEEIVALVENDACDVDAVQVVSGCTFGKGNLIFRDHGKSVYTFLSRRTGEGIRVAWHAGAAPDAVGQDRRKTVAWILQAPAEAMLELRSVHVDLPERARMYASVVCDACGEQVMRPRTEERAGRTLCLPCARDQ